MPNIQCKVEEITALTEIVNRVILVPLQPFHFIAGQYLQVIMGDSDKRPFSIANAPREDGKLELHIGADPKNMYAAQVLILMRETGHVEVDGGHGKAFLPNNKPKPTILLAGGTGFSYASSVLQQLLCKPLKEPVFLYWGTRTLNDMYAYQMLTDLDTQHKRFRFIPVIETPQQNWQGKTGWVHKAVLADFVSLEPYQVCVAGRFEMAGIAREEFHQQGLLMSNLYGDAYEFI
ncbi:MAG: aquacobalamin reductase/NAD(P)H-flavin reductase [Paraglaciecola sp.]|jgi:aquacobalamin reductase/NAD(P)H-flavin reductase